MTAADGPDDLDDFVAEQMKDPLFAAQYRAAQLGAELQRLRQQVGAVWALCSALADVPAETPDDAAGEAS
jgi:hypothetical protein